jgi:hypothetical protein
LRTGGESGILFAFFRKAQDFPDSLGNREPNSKCNRSLKPSLLRQFVNFLTFIGKTEPLITRVSTAISGRHSETVRGFPDEGRERVLPFTPAPPSPAATSLARSRSPKAGALPHFLPMCRTAQTRSVSGSSFPNCHLREKRRSTPRSERVPPAPELQPRGFLAGRKEAIRNEVIEQLSGRARTLFPGNYGFLITRRPLGTFHHRDKTCYGSSPKTATPFGVPTNTLPLTIIGVMNLLPEPN